MQVKHPFSYMYINGTFKKIETCCFYLRLGDTDFLSMQAAELKPTCNIWLQMTGQSLLPNYLNMKELLLLYNNFLYLVMF